MVSFYTAHFVLKGDLGFVQVHWLHLVGLNFLWMVGIMMVVRYLKPMSQPYEQVYTNQVEVKPWKYAAHASWAIVGLLALLYTVFSEIGILGEQGSAGKVMAALSLVAAAVLRSSSFANPPHIEEIPPRSAWPERYSLSVIKAGEFSLA